MCIICVDLDKNKLTPWEASKNRLEMLKIIPEDHLEELDEKITQSLHQYLNSIPCHLCNLEEEKCLC